MKIAFYGIQFDESFKPVMESLFDEIKKRESRLVIHKDFAEFLEQRMTMKWEYDVFSNHKDLKGIDVLISVGGDGTLLSTIHYIRDSEIPVLGVNAGRLGFLSHVSADQVEEAVDDIFNGNYTIDERSLIKTESPQQSFGEFPYSLNEVTLLKKDTSSMIRIHAYLDETFINTYWADGLIICTPTGSTAYSLSCNGPIVMPGSDNFTITPIAPHNLNVRPLVLPNNHTLKISAEGREPNFLLALDSNSFAIDSETEVFLSASDFNLKLIKLKGHDFFNTIRNKMMWGIDRRN